MLPSGIPLHPGSKTALISMVEKTSVSVVGVGPPSSVVPLGVGLPLPVAEMETFVSVVVLRSSLPVGEVESSVPLVGG